MKTGVRKPYERQSSKDKMEKEYSQFLTNLFNNSKFLNQFYKTLVGKENAWKNKKMLTKYIEHLSIDNKYVNYIIAMYGENIGYTFKNYPEELKEGKLWMRDIKNDGSLTPSPFFRGIEGNKVMGLSINSEYEQIVEGLFNEIDLSDPNSVKILLENTGLLFAVLYKIYMEFPSMISDYITRISIMDNLNSI